MMQIDHLVFAADDLETGRAWMERTLGVAPGGAGVHPLMGTHNALWSLGGCYLEVIAVDPTAEVTRPRWFGLDDPQVRASLQQGPRLLTWVARVDDLTHALGATALPLGEGVRVTRTGLHWDLSVRPDGALVEQGRAPTLIEWPADVTTPERSLPDSGITLERLTIAGASLDVQTLVREIEAVQCVASPSSSLSATFTTPRGPVSLTS
jgi:catechol 2,3-dioxygenase-like lactoylglutathione lyase family enzyme